MRKRAVLSFVVLLFIICSIISGPTYASDIWIVDGNVDPWADLEDLEDYTPPPVAVPVPDGVGEEDIMPLADFDYGDASVTWNGVVTTWNASSYNSTSTVYKTYSSGTWSMSDVGAYRFSMFAYTLNTWDYRLSVAANSYAQFNFGNMFPEFLGSVDLTFNLYFAFQYSAIWDTYSYQYKGPESVTLWTGTEWLACDFSWTDQGQQSVLTVTVSLTPSQAQGFSDSPSIRVSMGSSFIVGSKITASGNSYGSRTKYMSAALIAGVQSITYEVETDIASETNENVKGIFATVKAIFNSIINLPMNIANFIIDGFKSLFVPTAEQLQAISAKYNDLFEEKLGFVYQMFSFVVDTFGQFKETLTLGETYSFVFPGIEFPYEGETYVILPETQVSLDNPAMDVLRPILGTMISMIFVLAVVSTGFDMVVAVMSGASYMEFLGQKREEFDI